PPSRQTKSRGTATSGILWTTSSPGSTTPSSATVGSRTIPGWRRWPPAAGIRVIDTHPRVNPESSRNFPADTSVITRLFGKLGMYWREGLQHVLENNRSTDRHLAVDQPGRFPVEGIVLAGGDRRCVVPGDHGLHRVEGEGEP